MAFYEDNFTISSTSTKKQKRKKKTKSILARLITVQTKFQLILHDTRIHLFYNCPNTFVTCDFLNETFVSIDRTTIDQLPFADVLESREIFTGSQCGFMSVCILKTSERRDTMLILTAGEARKRGWLLPGVRSLIYHCPLKYRAGTNTRGINRRRLIHGAGQVERWHILTFPTTHERPYIQKARYGEEMVGKKSYSGSHFPFS